MTYRTLATPYGTWHYFIGHTMARLIGPAHKVHVVSLSDLTGRPCAVIEHGQWKQTSDGMVTPGDVRAYLDKLQKVEK